MNVTLGKTYRIIKDNGKTLEHTTHTRENVTPDFKK